MAASSTRARPAADELAPVVESLLGRGAPVALRCWDGSTAGPAGARTTVVVRSPRALRRLLWAPGELGLARALVAGELDVEGDVFDVLELRGHLGHRPGAEPAVGWGPAGLARLAGAALRLGAVGPPLPPPPEEARLHGRRHGRRRDAAAVAHHYDVAPDFYRLLLGPSLTYSCAYWAEGVADLDGAQAAKHELVCRKLGLRPGQRLLDVGCGWGSTVLHAARHHGVRAVGVTLSAEQAELARRRVVEAGLGGRVEIRLADYRDLDDGPYDAIASVGMFEHVGSAQVGAYVSTLARLLRPGGRLLNHAISRPRGRGPIDPRSFVGRYVFPDAELHEVGRVVTALDDGGLEVRDVESLREHYARTLRAWVARLEAGWDEAVALVGRPRAQVWRLYLAGSAVGFEAGRLNVHQVLAVAAAADGASGMPATRRGWWWEPESAPPASTAPELGRR